MQKVITKLPAIKLVGLTARTNNSNETSNHAKIPMLLQQYFNILGPYLTAQSITYSLYHEYATDMHGDYSYFIGTKPEFLSNPIDNLVTINIPEQTYVKFTNDKPGAMPMVCINMWQEIWQMSEATLGGTRSYQADFEIYDQRAQDNLNTTLDICIGIK